MPLVPKEKMMKAIQLLILFVTGLASTDLLADVNILVIGSTHSFSEGNERGVVRESAFNSKAVAESLRNILGKDSRVSGKANVVFEDIYRSKVVPTALGQRGNMINMQYRCYSLAQYFMWPEGKEARLRNLAGKAGTQWDYVVIIGDPYLLANLPGGYAEGVFMIATQARVGKAKPVLLMQWPTEGSAFETEHFGKIVYRVGRSAGIAVAPAGYAWKALAKKDRGTGHPSPAGAYLAAASLYSEMFGRSASTSDYRVDDSIADHALKATTSNRNKEQYEGRFEFKTPFSMKYVNKRAITYNHTGSSSENGIKGGLEAAIKRCGVAPRKTNPAGNTKVDFNYGRANSNFEPRKKYKVAPNLFDRSYGFPMQESRKSAGTSMLYGIDKRYIGSRYDDGTDMGIAYDMIRQKEVASDIRCVPIRLMWAKMQHANNKLQPLRDGWHMSQYLDQASGTFMYTLLSGRCPVDKEPARSNAKEWNRWFAQKIGYETAWQMSHLQARAPGFRVLPSSIDSLTIAPGKTMNKAVKFVFPPAADVKVLVSIDKPGMATVRPSTLTFTPRTHASPKVVRISVSRSAKGKSFNVIFRTESRDEVCDGLTDTWAYRVE